MVGFTTAMAISAGLGAAGSIYSANQQSQAAKRSAQAVQSAGDQNIAEQRRQYDLTRSDQMPFLQSDYARRAMADRTYGIQGTGGGVGGNMSLNQARIGQPDYGSYVRAYPDLQAAYDASGGQYGGIEDFGAIHYQTHGQGEGRNLTNFQAPQGQTGQVSNQAFDPLADFRKSADYALINYKPTFDAVNAAWSSKGAGLDSSATNAATMAGTSLVRNAFSDFRGGLEGRPTGAVNALGAAGQNMVNNNSNQRTNTANALASSYGQRADANSSAVGGVIGAGNWFANQTGMFGKPRTTTPPYRGY